MFKLLFSTAIVAPVMMLAYSAGGDTLFAQDATASAVAHASVDHIQTAGQESECRSDTLGVSFRGPWLESHSAGELAHSFARVEGCEISFVRLTTLVPEEPSEADLRDADTRRGELALHIEALVGPERARDLPMEADVLSSITDARLRSHALLRIERRPATPGATVLSASATLTESESGSALVESLNP